MAYIWHFSVCDISEGHCTIVNSSRYKEWEATMELRNVKLILFVFPEQVIESIAEVAILEIVHLGTLLQKFAACLLLISSLV